MSTDPTPSPSRQIVLLNDRARTFLWTCSSCKWTTAFMQPDGKPADPVEAVKLFNQHRCEEHPAK
jgi:hypothetical protein